MALVPGASVVGLAGSVWAAWSDASRGDLRVRCGPGAGDPGRIAPLATLAADVAAATGTWAGTVSWAEQVHGAVVLDVAAGPCVAAGPDGAPPRLVCPGAGDALVSDRPGDAVCVLTADCGALALASPEGVFAAVHAGWRGLVAGVVEAAVERMRDLGATEVVGALGPCIHAECYEFSGADLDAAAAVYGDGVRGRTSGGHPALDVPAAIAAALARSGARAVGGVDACTACGEGYFSHRARRDAGRQALLVWAGGSGGPLP